MSSPLAASSPNSYLSEPSLSRHRYWIPSGSCRSRPRVAPTIVGAAPFPHIMLDGLFSDSLLDQAVAELPAASAKWTTYNTVNESKQVCSDASLFGPTAEIIVHALNSAPFVRFLERLTGITGLIPDPHLHAAGYMKVSPGGFLGLHYDFATQRELKLDRRINVLLYLNRDWQSGLGWRARAAFERPGHRSGAPGSDDRATCSIAWRYSTRRMRLHGHRKPLTCPKGRARLCLSWYYYTAPPVAGWAARSKAVEFRGKHGPEALRDQGGQHADPADRV